MMVGLIALVPDLDALLHVHRSVTHSIIILSIVGLTALMIVKRVGRPMRLAVASTLGLLSHPLLDTFQSPTPILYPLSRYSYHISPTFMVKISEAITPQPAIKVVSEPTRFTYFKSMDAPIFTDTGFIISLLLIIVPLIHSLFINKVSPTNMATQVSTLKNTDNTCNGPALAKSKHIQRNVDRCDVTILIPTLNEEEAIGRVIEEIKELGYENILVVDGYSTDKTVEIAEKCGAKVVYQTGLGKAAAIRTGINLAKTPYILVMDGDGTYDPRDIERMLDVAEGYDEVIGVRMNRGNIPLLHRIGNRLISSFLALTMGQRLADPCSGIYLLRTDTARRLELTSTGFDVEAEIAAQMLTLGKVVEVPVNYRRRIGRRKLRSFRDGLRIILTILKMGWLYNPVLLFSSIASTAALLGLGILSWQLYLRYTLGAKAWSIGWAWAGLTLLIIGVQSFTIAVISLMIKRMERRISEQLKQ